MGILYHLSRSKNLIAFFRSYVRVALALGLLFKICRSSLPARVVSLMELPSKQYSSRFLIPTYVAPSFS